MRTYSMFKKFFNKTIYDSNNTLVRSKIAVFFFKCAFCFMSWIGFSLGFIPQLSSFQRIFYTGDTSMFLVIYLTLLSITLV